MTPEKKKQPAGNSGAKSSSREPLVEKTGKPITVHAWSGFKKDEKPRSFEVDGKRLTVLSVKKTWQEESEKGRHRKTYFRIHAHNGRTYDISLDASNGEWTLEPGLREDR